MKLTPKVVIGSFIGGFGLYGVLNPPSFFGLFTPFVGSLAATAGSMGPFSAGLAAVVMAVGFGMAALDAMEVTGA